MPALPPVARRDGLTLLSARASRLLPRAPACYRLGLSLVTADAGFFSLRNEVVARERGVKRVAIPNLGTKSAERRRLHKKRWFRSAQKWRTGCEGRISLLKRRHGLNRCRYKGAAGVKRWVGLSVIADNLINIGIALASSAAKLTTVITSPQSSRLPI